MVADWKAIDSLTVKYLSSLLLRVRNFPSVDDMMILWLESERKLEERTVFGNRMQRCKCSWRKMALDSLAPYVEELRNMADYKKQFIVGLSPFLKHFWDIKVLKRSNFVSLKKQKKALQINKKKIRNIRNRNQVSFIYNLSKGIKMKRSLGKVLWVPKNIYKKKRRRNCNRVWKVIFV